MKLRYIPTLIALGLFPLIVPAQTVPSREYSQVQARLAKGWNTWNTNSYISHVHLPEGFAVNLGIKRVARTTEAYLQEAMMGRRQQDVEVVEPGYRAYDGSYSELTVEWQSIKLLVQSATIGDDLFLLVTPLKDPGLAPLLIVESAMLWNRPGILAKRNDALRARAAGREFVVSGTGESVSDLSIPSGNPYLAFRLDGPVGVSTGGTPSLEQIKAAIERKRSDHLAYLGSKSKVFSPIQAVMAWGTIYDPVSKRVMTTGSRIWNQNRGGYAVWCWDQFFYGWLAAATDNKGLAYANVTEMLNENRNGAFVPNVSQGNGRTTLDRSQPPVGSVVVREIYEKYKEKWFVRSVFNRLLRWNRWWVEKRLNKDGMLSWGSNLYVDPWKDSSVHNLTGAMLESGLDNSPMYDDVPFNKQTGLMELSDVGLLSLYVADCDALAFIADELGRTQEAEELRSRGEEFRKRLASLWNEEKGLFLNRRTDTGEWSTRISPTSFYPLLAKAATTKQAERMIKQHLLNPDEFWGEWVIPATPRSDPAFKDQDYWRGRIWAPMNLLVYLALKNYDFPGVRAELAKKSEQLLVKEWESKRHIHENYDALTGEGGEGAKSGSSTYPRSDPFHTWGALLGLIPFLENGER